MYIRELLGASWFYYVIRESLVCTFFLLEIFTIFPDVLFEKALSPFFC